jgi:hypothetical protein
MALFHSESARAFLDRPAFTVVGRPLTSTQALLGFGKRQFGNEDGLIYRVTSGRGSRAIGCAASDQRHKR